MSASSDAAEKVFGAFAVGASFPSSSSSSREPVESAEAWATTTAAAARGWGGNERGRKLLLLREEEQVSVRGGAVKAETAATFEKDENGRVINLSLRVVASSPPDRSGTELARLRGGKRPAELADAENVAREGGSIRSTHSR